MIRPFTCITVLLAFGSGLYLYQVKHRAQVVDRQIERTVKAITAIKMQTRELAAAWTLLGNPDRLQQLSDQFLTIKPVQPSQFVSMADLDSRLPAPLPPASAEPGDTGSGTVPVATAEPTEAPDTPTTPAPPSVTPPSATSPPGAPPSASPQGGVGQVAVVASVPPATTTTLSPAPRDVTAVARPGSTPASATDLVRDAPRDAPRDVPKDSARGQASAAGARPADRKPNEAPRPARDVAAAHAAPVRPAGRPPVIAELERPARPAQQHVAAPVPVSSSLLGMAQASVRPPAPLPVRSMWSNFNSNGN
jgi:hypothetical protein